MAWLISRALMEDFENSHSSPVQAGESSGGTSSDGEPSAPSSETPTPQAYLPADRMTDFSRLSRSGMTFAPLTADRGEAVLMWCQEGSRAKTSPQPGEVRESRAGGRDSGVKWRELCRRFDPTTSSWRTHRCLFDEALPECSVILPRWGMMRDGALLEQLTVGLPTNGIESGLWPTPTAQDANGRTHHNQTNGTKTLSLLGQVRIWPTPTSCMSKGSSPAALTRKDGKDRSNDRLDHAVMKANGGQLSPMWTEWLMGWPIGWTDLKPLGMDKFHLWRHSHGGS